MIFASKPVITQFFAENPEFYKQFGLFGHEGIDLVPSGTDKSVHSFIAGTVTEMYHSDVYGNTIILYSPEHRMSFRFAHLEYAMANVGEPVENGTFLGRMGNSPAGREGIDGKPMGEHLHLNCVPEDSPKDRSFPNNGFHGRVDPLGILRFLGEL